MRERAKEGNVSDSLWSTIETPLGPLWLWATSSGLCGAGFGARPDPRLVWRLQRYNIAPPDSGSSALLDQAAEQLGAYFAHDLRVFTIPLDLRGTPFQTDVWEALLDVPYGKTQTYGAIALALGKPQASQAVGQAVGANPVAIVVPCHRIVGHDGALTGYAGGVDRKATLLQLESYGYQLPMR